MTSIVAGVGISYPAYLSNYKSVRSKEIHAKAGVCRSHSHHPSAQANYGGGPLGACKCDIFEALPVELLGGS